MTLYSIGAAFERRVKADLEELGYFVVRSAGSHGPADLVALKKEENGTTKVMLCQCKTGGVISKSEREELIQTAEKAGAVATVVSRGYRNAIIYTEVKK